MSAIFNGTDAYLSTASHIIGATPNYPVGMVGWMKLTAVTARHVVLSSSDNQAAASQDAIQVEARGDIVNDPIYARSIASGSIVQATHNGLTAGSWIAFHCYWTSSADRFAGFAGAFGSVNSAIRNATGLAVFSIGAQLQVDVASDFFGGRLAEVGVLTGISTTEFTDTWVPAFVAGSRPPAITLGTGTLAAYQPFISGLNDAGFIGASWTNTNVTFDSADHPIAIPGSRDSDVGMGFGFGFGM